MHGAAPSSTHMASIKRPRPVEVPILFTLSAVLATLSFLASAPIADERVSRRDAASLKQKVASIAAEGQRTGKRGGSAQKLTTVTENEVNAYLAYDAPEQLPSGVVEPSVNILGTGRISGRAVVDLDAVRKQRTSTSLFDPTNYLRGRLPVAAAGMLSTSNGVGRFELESANVAGIPIPKVFLQEIVSYYSRTPDNPSGIALDDPFALPAQIREIQVERGQAVIVQ
jgi:hypothetical protein